MPNELSTLEIITRQEAKLRELAHYFTGKPCKNGHISLRSTKTLTCLACACEQTARYRIKNPSKGADYMRGRRADPAIKGKLRAAERQNYAKRKDHHRKKNALYRQHNPEYFKTYYQATKEAHRARGKEWRRANPDKVRAIKHRRRALERNAEGSFTDQDLQRIRALQKNRCAVCKTKLIDEPNFVHLDHILALVNGGTNWPWNLQFLCKHCNSSKNDRDQLVFMRSLDYLL